MVTYILFKKYLKFNDLIMLLFEVCILKYIS